MRALARSVYILGLASFFTDLSSEMIFPLLPVYLVSVLGAGALQLGLIEGIAETTASLLKILSGSWSDRMKRRKPLVVAGYSLSSSMRPLIGIAASWKAVLGFRFLDRVGKGIRTAPRDALIADVTVPEMRGRAYGFHRSLDHAGAVVGPLVASALLTAFGLSMRKVFLLAALPAAIAVLVLVFGIQEEARAPSAQAHAESRPSPLRSWSVLGSEYRALLVAVFVFTLGNATDAFLLARMSQAGVKPQWIAVIWSVHHVVKMVASLVGGRLADRFGPKAMIVSGWIIYAAVYLAFGWVQSIGAVIAVFLVYGLYHGFTEPSEKALVASVAPSSLRGSAFGLYHLVIGIGALPASVLFGWVWTGYGAPAAFMMGSALAFVASVLLLRVKHARFAV